MNICPFANPTTLCHPNCALLKDDKCSFLIIAAELEKLNQHQKNSDNSNHK